jgi:hypothetical protein
MGLERIRMAYDAVPDAALVFWDFFRFLAIRTKILHSQPPPLLNCAPILPHIIFSNKTFTATRTKACEE